jgi:predicted RNA-binding protein with PUA-like domain
LDPPRWLFKSEPSCYSYADLVRDKSTVWDGITNAQARIHLRSVEKGDLIFFYHTGEEKQIVGIGEIIREAFPDPTAKKDEGWVAVQTSADKPFPKPVTLAAVKAEPKLKEIALVKYGRLSVQPVTADEWKFVCKMGGLK